MAKEKAEKVKVTGLDKVMNTMNELCGPGTCVMGNQLRRDPPRLPFGVFAVDYASGGGAPLWGTTCLWGPESGGKTSLAINAMVTADMICWKCFELKDQCSCSTSPLLMRSMWVDVEGTLDRDWVTAIGVDPDRYVYGLADYGEQYVNLSHAAVEADDCGLLVVDSLAAMTPEAEMEAAAESDFIALQARMIGRFVRKMKQSLIKEARRGHPIVVLFTNQMRYKIGQMFGSPETMPGGQAMRHEFSLLIRCGHIALNKADKGRYIDAKNKQDMASRHSILIKKRKVQTLSGAGEFLRVGQNVATEDMAKGAIDDAGVILKYARDVGIVESHKNGWRYFDYEAKTLEDIKRVLRRSQSQRFLASRRIIELEKVRLAEELKGDQ